MRIWDRCVFIGNDFSFGDKLLGDFFVLLFREFRALIALEEGFAGFDGFWVE